MKRSELERNDKYILSSVDNALAMLNLFYATDELSASDVANRMNIGRSTAFRFLVTLENRGFLTKTESGKYRLGIKLFSLGQLAYSRMELISLIHPFIVNVASEGGETSHLAILDDITHVVFIDKAIGTRYLKMDTPIGFRQYAHLTATGKAILANQPEQVLNQYVKRVEFKKKTKNSIPSAKVLLETLDMVRKQSYACDNEEAEPGLSCFAVPIFDASHTAIAAISVSGPTVRLVEDREMHLVRLRNAADKIIELLN